MSSNITLTFLNGTNPGLEVLTLELQDRMSDLFSLTLLTQSTQADIEMKTLLGRAVAVGLGETGLLQRVTGIVRQVQHASTETTGISRYVLYLVPPLWLTTRRSNHRIFQNRTVPEIVQDILADYGERIPAPRTRFQRTYPRREYCTQYGETDCDFLHRILADEGITTFFDHSQGSAWVLVDDTTSLTPSLDAPIPFIEPSLNSPIETPHVQGVTVTAKIKTSAVALRDYDYSKPKFTLAAKETADGAELMVNEEELESYEFEVGKFSTTEDGDARAERLLDAARGPSRQIHMQTNFPLQAGTRLRIVGHPRGDVGVELLVTATTTMSQELASVHNLDCIEARAHFRPKRPPKPRIIGTQTAFVVGPANEEIDTDELGRVRIEFCWDRRDLHTNTSRLVRVSQAWAGPGYGLFNHPRVGNEVIVDFLDGDPDQPIIIGRVHNAVNMPPVTLPAGKTISVWRSLSSPGGSGFNQILLDDKSGAERLELHAQRDFKSETLRNASTSVGVNQQMTVGGNSTNRVTGAYSLQSGSTSISTGPYRLQASTIDATANTHMTLTAGDIRRDVSVNHFFETGGVWINASSITQIIAPRLYANCSSSITLESAGTVTLRAGGSSIEITPGGIKITSSGPVEINGSIVDVKGTPIKLNC